MKQVVVLGGTGYIGKPLIEKLCQEGFRVAAVARPTGTSPSPKRDTIPNQATQVGDSPPVLLEMTPIIATAEDASDFGKLPQNIRQLHRWAMDRRPGLNDAETADDCESRLEASQDAYPLANMPLVVVSTGNTSPGYKQLQAKLLSLSHNSRQEMAYDSLHFIAIDQPQVAIAAIRNVVGQVRLRASAEVPLPGFRSRLVARLR
jgi:NAD(P)-dependent dehydrogenase (short-subunit alcohol dehydrogenase family)